MLRMRAGLSVRDAAKLLTQRTAESVPSSTLGGWFSGSHLPTPKLVKSGIVAELLSVCGESNPVEVREWLVALQRVRCLPGRRPINSPSPFRGLATYEPEHADYFCGRQALTTELVGLADRARLLGTPLIVVGPSGSGKSSLLRAGLIPAFCCNDSFPAGVRWPYLLFTPGASPVFELACQLASLTGKSSESLHEKLLDDPQSCADMIGAVPTSGIGGHILGHQVLIVVDQFEELFTLCTDEAQQYVFIQALCAAAALPTDGGEPVEVVPSQPSVLVVLGMRADFYPQALCVPQLVPVLRDAQLVVGPMSEAQLRQAITEPTRRANLSLEPGLVEILLHDLAPVGAHPVDGAAHEPGALPLLSHALLATWEQAKGRTLTREHYHATGGIRGAVAKTAEDAFTGLATPEQQEIARRLFLRLIRTDDTADTRRRLLYSRLVEDGAPSEIDGTREVLDQFIIARLVTIDGDTIEITHEALLTAWPRLREWLDADAVWRRFHRRLTSAATHWQDTGRDPDCLYQGGVLETAREWIEDSDRRRELDTLEREFLDVSFTRLADEQVRTRRRVRRRYQLIALAAVLALAAVSVGAYARQLQLTGEREQTQAAHAQAEALSRLVASKADRLRDEDVSLSMQLALAAYRIAPTPEARSSLLNSTAIPTAARLLSPAGPVRSIAVSRQGNLLAAGIDKGPLQLWTLDDAGRPTFGGAPVIGATDTLMSLAFSPDGHILAAGGKDTVIHLWDTTTPAHPLAFDSLTGPSKEIFSVAVSPDGRTLAAGGADTRTYLWNITDPAHAVPLTTLAGPSQTVRAVAFTPDGRTLAVGSDDATIHLWDIDDPAHPVLLGVLTGPTSKIFCLAISPDGHHLAAGTSSDDSVYLWDISHPAHPLAEGPPLTGPASWINSVAFSPDGRTLAVGSSDTLLWLFDLDSRQPIGRLPHPRPLAASLYRTGQSLVTVADDGTIRDWDLPGPIITGASASVFAVSFDATGHRLGIGPGSADNTVTVWDPTNTHHPALLGPPIVNAADASRFSGSGALTPDGRVFAVGARDGSVQLWDVSNPRSSSRIGPPIRAANDLVESVTISTDGHLLAVNADDNTVHLINIADPRRPLPLATLTGSPPDVIYHSGFSPDGKLLAVASQNRSVYLWDISNPTRPKLLATLGGFTDAAYSAAFSPDGHILAVGSADSTVRLWDVTHPDHPDSLGNPLTGPVSYVYSIAFNPHQNILAAASTDNTIWLWDLRRPRQPTYLATLTGPTNGVLGVAISPDGHTLAAGGHDRTVRLWNTDPTSAATWICTVVGQAITEQEWKRYIPELPYTPPCR
ncbi:MAG: NACHT and WD repeat domain-containing protein [Sciscionella sp.]